MRSCSGREVAANAATRASGTVVCPCVRGMRIRVSDVLELLANGASIEEILADYPCLERDDILAAIAYAAQQTNHVVVEVA